MALSDAAKFDIANSQPIKEGDEVFVSTVLRRGIVVHVSGRKATVVEIDGIPLEVKISDVSRVQ